MKKSIIILMMLLMAFGAFAQQVKDTVRLKEIEIQDSLIRKSPYMLNVVNQQQLQSENIHDLSDYLRNIPNISGIRKGGISINPVVRGLKYGQLNVSIDNGVKLENLCPNRTGPVSSHVEAEDIEKIEVTKGPFVLRYGPSLGSNINLVSESPHPYEKFEIHAKALYGFETNWNGQKEHLSIYGGGKRVYFLVSGDYKDYGNYHSGNLDGHDTTYISSFLKYNYSAKLGFSITPKQSIILSYNGIYDKDMLNATLPMDDKSGETHIVSVDYNIKNISNSIKALDIKLYQSDVSRISDNSKRAGSQNKLSVVNIDGTNTGGRAEMTMQFKKNRVLTGLDFENTNKNGERTVTTITPYSVKKANLWKDALIQNAGLFVEYNRFISSFEINAGIRGDLNNATSEDTLKIIKNGVEYFNKVSSQFVNLSANVGITKKISESFNISFAAGRGMRSPDLIERYIKLFPVGYNNYDYLGNPQLKPETNNEADLTFKFKKENIGGFYLNGFYSYVQDYITSTLVPSTVVKAQTQGVLGVRQYINADYVTFKGFEFGYTSPDKYKLGASVVAAYTYTVVPSATKYTFKGNQVTETVIKNDGLQEVPPLESTIHVYYKLLKGTLIPKLSFRAVADQRHTSEAFSETYTPGFGLMNFAVKYKINKYADINTGVDNIFDRGYYEHLNKIIIGGTGRLYEPGRVFFISLQVKV